MKKYLYGIIAAVSVLASSCTTLTKWGLNPAEDKVKMQATVIRAGVVKFDRGTDALGKGRGRTACVLATSGYKQTVVIRTSNGQVFTHEHTSSLLGTRGLHVGQTGVAEVGKVSKKLWDFTPN